MNQYLMKVIKGRMICSPYPSRSHNESFLDPMSSTFLACPSFSLHYQVSGICLAHISLSDLATTSLSLIQWHVPFPVNISFSSLLLSCGRLSLLHTSLGQSFSYNKPLPEPMACSCIGCFSFSLYHYQVSSISLAYISPPVLQRPP